MASKILTTVLLAGVFLFAPQTVWTQERGRGARGTQQRGTQRRPPATYYGGGIYGPGRRGGYQDQRWRGVPGGRFWRGQYYAPGVGPCWVYLPIVGWSWTCGP